MIYNFYIYISKIKNAMTTNARTFVNGAIAALIGAVIPVIIATANAGSLTFNWTAIGTVAISAFCGYVLERFSTNKTKEAEKVLQEENQKKAQGFRRT